MKGIKYPAEVKEDTQETEVSVWEREKDERDSVYNTFERCSQCRG